MSGKSPRTVDMLSLHHIGDKFYLRVVAPSYAVLETYRKPGAIFIVSAAKSCPEEEVETIKALCDERGHIFETDATGPLPVSEQESSSEEPSAVGGEKEKD